MSLLFLYFSLILMVCMGPLMAGSPISSVGAAKIDAGDLKAEYRIGYSRNPKNNNNHRRLRMRQHIEYGFSDSYGMQLTLAQDRRYGGDLEHQSIALQQKFQWLEQRDYGFDAGFRIVYDYNDHDKRPHQLDVRALIQIPYGGWEFRHNVIFDHDVGAGGDSGFSLQLRHQLKYALGAYGTANDLSVGLEMFNDFGPIRKMNGFHSGEHQIGPVIDLSFHDGLYIQTGYRYGISDFSSEHIVKLFMGHKF